MATYTKLVLSGSTDGKGIKITASGSSGDTIHAAHATDLDEIWAYAVNSSASAIKLTVEWGQVDAPDGNIETTIGGESGLFLIIPGLLLTNSLVVKAFAATTDVVIIHGFVNRITT